MEPYGCSDLGRDPSDDEPPSMTSASPSEDDDPEDPENRSGRKKKKKRKTKRPDRCRSQEAKAIATSKIVVNFPEFTGKDLSEFAGNFARFLGLTGQTHASGRVKCDLLLQYCKTKYLEKQVKPWVVVGAGGLGAGKTSGAGTRGVSLDVVIEGRTGDTDTNGGESSDNRSKVHADCGPAENPSL